jgi:hypothetical protein
MNALEDTVSSRPKPFPGLQQRMAHEVAGDQVRFNPVRAQWWMVRTGLRIGGSRGRSLRELERSGYIELVDVEGGDGDRAARLTEAGRDRYRPPQEADQTADQGDTEGAGPVDAE